MSFQTNPLPTAEQLRELASVDVCSVDKGTLVDIGSVVIDRSLSKEQQMLDYLKQIKNPFCYLDQGYVVKLSFTDVSRCPEERLYEFLQTASQES